eukprot:gnl/TRDRNA2_/TRDRNA2_84168_c0_seq1.p1 gnl/TRDRNA2_/TRDRNA2_84168_c0~~gnl/TRDRNA2_/TRDRNA2_84168_c0_seq1.p1  ORF type:complete len:174 (-),score=40.16 gnl/TRDRNA2_/TRDRNA2_84168_c0_seq1:131-652(-)
MIKIFGVGRGNRGAPASESNSDEPPAKKRQPGQIRMQKELDELELPPQCQIEFPDKDSLMHFKVHITPDEGFWKGATYTFVFNIAALYPHEAPKVKCETKVYHPNIDLQGNVCLNILREDWKPVLAVSSVVYGLLYLFLEPNPADPLNHEAAQLLRDNRAEFARVVRRSLGTR